MPSTFVLQEHTPLELHDVEVDPKVLHPQAKKVLNNISVRIRVRSFVGILCIVMFFLLMSHFLFEFDEHHGFL